MKRVLTLSALALWAFLPAVPAIAAPTFFDSFDGENGGVSKFNYIGFANWTVSNGTVDLIGNAWYDFQPGNGLYVDLDGSTRDAGKITSVPIDLVQGTYELSFDLAGNLRDYDEVDTATVQVDLGNLLDKVYSLPKDAPFTRFTETLMVSGPTTVTLSFEGSGGDNVGMLLDNVAVNVIPAPGALMLGGLGVGIAGWLRRRRML
jgi:hypothetical protein